MVHQASGQSLAEKEALRCARRGQGPQNDLQCDSLAHSFIRSCPHRRHSTFPNQVLDSVFSAYQLACPQDRVDGGLKLGFRFHHRASSQHRHAAGTRSMGRRLQTANG
jgi:hypothetical protein